MSINPNKIELEVEAGPERGRRYAVEQAGARIGRDPSNDFVVNDPSLSRFHCRIYLAGDGQARVADLGSTNTTEVNGSPISDVALVPGDRIAIGDTILRVMGAAPKAAAIITAEAPAGASLPPPPPVVAPGDQVAAPSVPAAGEMPDLFGRNTAVTDAATRKHVSKTLWLVVGLLLVVVTVVTLLKLGLFDANRRNAIKGAALSPLEIMYEKVDATSSNIFRYELTLLGSNLVARVDNLADARHTVKEKKLDVKTLDKLISQLENTGFFGLDNEYKGAQTDLLDSHDLTITMGSRTKRVLVVNRVAPESFKKASDIVETFGQNTLGMLVLSVTPDKLVEMAREAMLQGKKYFDEREVSFGSLYKAMKAFEAADVYLETLDPKPDFYQDIVGGHADAKKMLQERYDNYAFRAEKAIKIEDWQEANKNLQTILESIPDREDERYKQAKIKKLDVERHLKPNR